MKKKVFITFGDAKFRDSVNRIIEEARLSHFFNKCIAYSPKDFDEGYWSKYYSLYESNSRGYGFWIWKSYFIGQTLKKLKDDDILVYLDAGCEINRYGFLRFHQYIKEVRHSPAGLLVFQNGYKERQWTKGDVFDFFNVRNVDEIIDSEQIMAGVLIIRNCQRSREFIKKWYNIVHDSTYLVTDETSNSPNYPGFLENRHDQSVFSLLCKTHRDIVVMPNEEVDPNCWKSKFWKKIEYLPHPFIISRRRNGTSYFSKSFSVIVGNITKSIFDYFRVCLGSYRQRFITKIKLNSIHILI